MSALSALITQSRNGQIVRVAVLFVAGRVGVAGQVEPLARPMLAVGGRCQQPIDQPLVGVRAVVGDKRVDLLERRRQADQIERQPADQAMAIGLRLRAASPACSSRASTKWSIALRHHSGRDTFGSGGRCGGSYDQCREYSAPAAIHSLDLFDFLGGQASARLRRRHPLFGILARDAADQLAFVGRARHDRAEFDGRLALVQPQIRLAMRFVRPVAREAILRQNRPDLEAEIRAASRRPAASAQQKRRQRNGDRAAQRLR